MAWTDDRVEKLKTMWTEGNSASQIAKELGGVTRNAVIGKVHRLGLSNRASSTKPIRDKASVRSAPKSRSKPSSPRMKQSLIHIYLKKMLSFRCVNQF